MLRKVLNQICKERECMEDFEKIIIEGGYPFRWPNAITDQLVSIIHILLLGRLPFYRLLLQAVAEVPR